MNHKLLYILALALVHFFSQAQTTGKTWIDVNREGLEAHQNQNYVLAEEKFKSALRLAELEFGKEHLNYAFSLNNLGDSYELRGEFAKAEPLYLGVSLIFEKKLGGEDPNYAFSLNKLAGSYQSQGKYIKAELFYLKASTILRNTLGENDLDYATSLEDLAFLYQNQGGYVKAESIYLEAMAIREKEQGRDHPDYLVLSAHFAGLYQAQGNYSKAEGLYLELISIFEKILGKEHPDYAILRNNLALLYEAQGDYSKSEILYKEALATQENGLNQDDPDYATLLHNLASLYRKKGSYNKSESLYLESKAIFEKAFGKAHPQYAASLNGLAELYKAQGLFAKSEKLYLEAIATLERALGKQNLNYAISLNSLAGLYLLQGEYLKAESLYFDTMPILEAVLGKQHPDYATTLNDLATLYQVQGINSKAHELFLQAIEIRANSLGKKHPDYATSLNNLAILYQYQGYYVKAENLYEEALAIRKMTLGKGHVDYSNSLNNLSTLYLLQGKHDKAILYLKEALTIKEKIFGRLNFEFAKSLGNLAVLFLNIGEIEKAEPLFLEVLAIQKEMLGRVHPDFAISLSSLAILNRTKGDIAKASTFFAEALDIFLLQLDQNLSHLSEKEKDKFFQTFDYNFELYHSFVIDHAAEDPELLASDFNYVLATKGLLFDFSEKIRDRVLGSKDTAIVRLYNEWRDQGQYVNGLYRVPEQKRKEREIDLKKEAEQLNKLEKELSARSALFASDKDTIKYTWQDVQGQLLPGEAAVEMVRFRYHKKEWTDSVIYMALVVTPETEGHPELVVLPDGNKLEGDYLSAYRRKLKKVHKDTDSYRHYWAPLSEKLKGIKKVYLSADGVYHKISLAGLYNEGDGNYLADKLTIHRVSGTDQLVKEIRKRQPMNQAYLVGSPSFNKPKDIAGVKNWTALPYTLKEVGTLEHILQEAGISTTVFTKDKATEEEVKSWDNPRIVHLATHALFLEDKAIKHAQMQSITGLDQSVLYQNPLLRSVMLLANAKGELYGEGTSGALSAKEVLNLKLDQTELVVLSACETGKGVIKHGEGIYGLQRAFLTAGAETVLASLWKVDDEVTQELMADFYKNWLIEGLTKREAFKKARKSIKYKYGAPRYWAAFVMIGR